jgi:hypothetical protein
MAGEIVRARGHGNVTAAHRSTFEVTRDPEITRAADCIIAVAADKAASLLSEEFKAAAARDDARITAAITCGGMRDTVRGWGSRAMTFEDDRSMVFRVSSFVCGRTVMIDASKPASGLDRALVARLATGADVTVELTVERGTRPRPSFDILFEG